MAEKARRTLSDSKTEEPTLFVNMAVCQDVSLLFNLPNAPVLLLKPLLRTNEALW